METGMQNAFEPKWSSPPGETIADILRQRGISYAALAKELGIGFQDTVELMRGNVVITSDLASRLANTLGPPKAFWLAREEQFRQDQSRELRSSSRNDVDSWLQMIPVGELIALGWIKNPLHDNAINALRFFGVGTLDEWRAKYRNVLAAVAFRTSPSFASLPGATLAWLRKCELQGMGIECKKWNPETLRESLGSIRSLTRVKDPSEFIPRLQEVCAYSGVATVVVKAPSGCKASGATVFLSSSKALLMLSGRHRTDDHFWFTFFHEVGHLLLHGKSRLFVDGETEGRTIEEKQADDFAGQLLIPPELEQELMALPCDGRAVMRYAKRVGLAPGVVVGQMQHRNVLTHAQLNNLKVHFSGSESD